MKQELSDRLIAAFPRLYHSWQGRDMDQVWRTRQDFECDNGWFALATQRSDRNLDRCPSGASTSVTLMDHPEEASGTSDASTVWRIRSQSPSLHQRW